MVAPSKVPSIKISAMLIRHYGQLRPSESDRIKNIFPKILILLLNFKEFTKIIGKSLFSFLGFSKIFNMG